MTLLELQSSSGIPFKTISAFEQGRSTNINRLHIYYNACKTPEQEQLFITELTQQLKENKHGN